MHTLYNSSPETYVLLLDNAAPDSCCDKRSSYLPTYPRLISTTLSFHEKTSKHAVLRLRRSRLLLCRAPVAHTHISTFGIYSSHGWRENVGTERPTDRADRPTDRPTRQTTITLRCACAARVNDRLLVMLMHQIKVHADIIQICTILPQIRWQHSATFTVQHVG